jgi:hypothetical protein
MEDTTLDDASRVRDDSLTRYDRELAAKVGEPNSRNVNVIDLDRAFRGFNEAEERQSKRALAGA